MFRKKTYIKFEFVPEGTVIKTNIDKNTDAEEVADFLNGLLNRAYLASLLEIIQTNAKKNNVSKVGEEIYQRVLEYQSRFSLKPNNYNGRPVISPIEVMKVRDEQN